MAFTHLNPGSNEYFERCAGPSIASSVRYSGRPSVAAPPWHLVTCHDCGRQRCEPSNEASPCGHCGATVILEPRRSSALVTAESRSERER